MSLCIAFNWKMIASGMDVKCCIIVAMLVSKLYGLLIEEAFIMSDYVLPYHVLLLGNPSNLSFQI